MNFCSIASNVYDILAFTYFRNPKHNPRVAIRHMISDKESEITEMCCGTPANIIAAAIELRKCEQEK